MAKATVVNDRKYIYNIMEKPLIGNDLVKLRNSGILFENEVALLIGDVVIAENVITKTRRVLEVSSLMLESQRKLLSD